MGNKQAEINCLERVFKQEKQCYGKVRKFINKLNSMNRIDFERPDFIFYDDCGNYIGLEHFVVDKFSQKNKNGKIASNGMLSRKNIDFFKDKWVGGDKVNERNLSYALTELAEIIGDYMAHSLDSTYYNYCQSFDYSLKNHLVKTKDYKEQIKKEFKAKKEQIKMGFLIEIHADFNNLYLNDKNGIHKNKFGFVPIFSEIVSSLKNIRKEELDFIILISGENLFDGSDKIVIVRPNRIQEDLSLQKITIYEYASHDCALLDFFSIYKEVKIDTKVEKKENTRDFIFSISASRLNDEMIQNIVFYSFYKAAWAKQNNKNFACSHSILLLIEVYLKYVAEWRKSKDIYGNTMITPVFNINSKELLQYELQEFKEKWH